METKRSEVKGGHREDGGRKCEERAIDLVLLICIWGRGEGTEKLESASPYLAHLCRSFLARSVLHMPWRIAEARCRYLHFSGRPLEAVKRSKNAAKAASDHSKMQRSESSDAERADGVGS